MNELRRKKDNKPPSRIPTKSINDTVTSTTTATTLRHNNSVVTLSKLDDKKTTSQICSRQHVHVYVNTKKNYNKRPIVNNKNLSSLSLTSKLKNMNNKPSIVTTTKKSSIPVKSNTTTTIKKPTQQQTLKPIPRKSPITQLKEDLESLRKQNVQDESLIKKQNEEILNLKKKLVNNKTKKAQITPQLAQVAKEKENVVQSSQLQSPSKTDNNLLKYKEQIDKLQIQLEKEKDDFQKKLAENTRIAIEMDKNIQEHQELINRLKLDHKAQLSQLESIHTNKLKQLELEHDRVKSNIKKQFTVKPTKKESTKDSQIDDLIEQALIEFEQEQHYHLPTLKKVEQHNNNNQGRKLINSIIMKSQQWYSKNYMPVDALSWPAPQILPHHLKRVSQKQQIC